MNHVLVYSIRIFNQFSPNGRYDTKESPLETVKLQQKHKEVEKIASSEMQLRKFHFNLSIVRVFDAIFVQSRPKLIIIEMKFQERHKKIFKPAE